MQIKHAIKVGVLTTLLMLGGCKLISADGECTGLGCPMDCTIGGICFP